LQRELERAVLQKTLDLLKDLTRALKLSINVSLETFIQEDLPALIAGLSSDRIILKLTENDYLVSIAAIQTQIKQLNRLVQKSLSTI
jgi:EAL domain-containing protein (putative c-di-GMP-specific phosphodiesterase class I)